MRNRERENDCDAQRRRALIAVAAETNAAGIAWRYCSAMALAGSTRAVAAKLRSAATISGRGYQPFAISRMRNGLRTVIAMIAAMMLRTAAIIKTAVQLPVAVINTFPSGTRSAAVPLAVYNMP